MSRGGDILTHNFAKIADYLDCSVDYLLGRTDNPEINRECRAFDKSIEPDKFIVFSYCTFPPPMVY